MKNPFKNRNFRLIPEDREQPFLEHLEAFRQMIFRCLISIAACTAIFGFFAKPAVHWLQVPLWKAAEQKGYDFQLITTSPVEGFLQFVKVVFALGVLTSLPLLIWFIARFIFPGLKPKERKVLTYGGIFGAILFVGGVAFCYFITLPIAINIMFRFNEYLGTAANWKIDAYLGLVMQMLIGFGLAFELPLILILAGRMGLVTVQQLTTFRRHVIIGILVVAMFLTPPDIITQLEMAIPLYLLYECCIVILRLFNRRSEKEGGDSAEEGMEK